MKPTAPFLCGSFAAAVVLSGFVLSLRGLWAEEIGTDDSPLAPHYGFLPVEVYKLSDRSASLLTGDFNHDGLMDLVLSDNGHSRLDFLLQRSSAAPTSATRKSGNTNVNDVINPTRLEQKQLPVDHEILSLAVGDLDHDGKTDVAYLGVPDQLVLRYQPDSGEWTRKQQIRIPDLTGGQWGLAAGDLNGDGRHDVVVLGRAETWLFHQTEQGELGSPVRLMNTSDKVALAQIGDLDGDGRQDLTYLAGDGLNRVLCARLQQSDGKLSSEYVFNLERPRAVTLREVDGKPGLEILTIDSRTGRVKLSNVVLKSLKSGELPERLIQFGFGKPGAGKDRDLVLADFDADGLTDAVVSDPEGSRVLLFRQRPGLGLDQAAPQSSLIGTDQLRAAKFPSDPVPTLFVESPGDKTFGAMRWSDGRLMFPEALSIEGEPTCPEIVDLNRDGSPELCFLSRTKEGKETSYLLQAVTRTADKSFSRFQGADGKPWQVAFKLKGSPERLVSGDLNGDQRLDFIVFQGSNRSPQVFLADANGQYAEVVATGSLGLGNIASGAAWFATLNGHPGLLLAQDSLARHLYLDARQRWQVSEQFNLTEPNSKIVGIAQLELDGEAGSEPELVLVDAGVRKLRVWRKEKAGWQPWKEVDLPDFPFLGLAVGDVNHDQLDDLLILGADRLAVLYRGGTTPVLEERATYESPLEKIYPTDLLAGDLNHDGHVDLVLTDVRSHFIELLQYRAPASLQHALYFRMFEQKSLQNEDAAGSEPREGVVVDITGDGLVDLVLLAYDRIVIYPQDPAKPAVGPAARRD